jgi:hypothetical protein
MRVLHIGVGRHSTCDFPQHNPIRIHISFESIRLVIKYLWSHPVIRAQSASHIGRSVVARQTEVRYLNLDLIEVVRVVSIEQQYTVYIIMYFRDLRSRWMMGGSLVCKKTMPLAICWAMEMRADQGNFWLDSCNRSKRVDWIVYIIPHCNTRWWCRSTYRAESLRLTSPVGGGVGYAPKSLFTSGTPSMIAQSSDFPLSSLSPPIAHATHPWTPPKSSRTRFFI